jgi:protein transport protein SEC13
MMFSNIIINKIMQTSSMKLFDQILSVITVNSVAWAPHEYGLVLCCGSSDGSVSILTSVGSGHWDAKKIVSAHTVRNS